MCVEHDDATGEGGSIYRRHHRHHHHHHHHTTTTTITPRRWSRATAAGDYDQYSAAAATAAAATVNAIGADKQTARRQEVFETSVDLASLVCVGQGSHDLAALGPLPLNFVVFNMRFSRSIYVDPMQLARLSRPHKPVRLPSQPQRHIVAASRRPLSSTLADTASRPTASAASSARARAKNSSTLPSKTGVGVEIADDEDTLTLETREQSDDDADDDDVERDSTVRNRVSQIMRYVGNDTLVGILTCMRQLKEAKAKSAALEKVS